jgi:microcystin-dependent protein
MSETINVTISPVSEDINISIQQPETYTVAFYDIAVPDSRVAQALADTLAAKAAALVSETAAASSASAASTSASSASSSASAASSSASSASTSASTATTQASNASSSASSAATSASTATTQASNASTSASAASTSATNAASSATAASTSATNAATSETNAAASAATAASAVSTHASLTSAHGATGAVVGTTNTQTLTNKTLTSPVINSPTGISKTDVGLSNVDNTSDAAKNSAVATLTNKTLSDSTTSIVDVGDSTKKILFDAGGTTGTSSTITGAQTANRVITLPNATTTLDGIDNTATLTNKTIVVANNTITTAASGGVTATELNSAIAQIATLLAASAGVATGAMIPYAGATAPTGYLLCDGSLVSRTTYSALFTAISTAYGSGDGSTTFGVPDMRGAFVRGRMGISTVTGSGTAATNNATFTAHGLNRTGMRVRLSSGTLSGLTTSTDYFAIVIDANTLAFATTYANALAVTKIAITGANSAVIAQWEDPDVSTRVAHATGGNSTTSVGSRQADELKSHSHTFDCSASDVANSLPPMGGAPFFGTNSTNLTGGNETRPNNIYMNYIIKT